ncbi:MAG: hypothetical protein ACFB9N_11255 [Geitlerinemataceae cyanobacterium]
MSQYERLLMMAEDELTEYSTKARKIEKLRRKIGLSVPRREQESIQQQLRDDLNSGGMVQKVLATQRQSAALPFWGIAGLGLLFGISLSQPLDFLAVLGGGAAAIAIQRAGWKLQAKGLLLDTLDDIDDRIKNPDAK